jgi:hypothetical protein
LKEFGSTIHASYGGRVTAASEGSCDSLRCRGRSDVVLFSPKWLGNTIVGGIVEAGRRFDLRDSIIVVSDCAEEKDPQNAQSPIGGGGSSCTYSRPDLRYNDCDSVSALLASETCEIEDTEEFVEDFEGERLIGRDAIIS